MRSVFREGDLLSVSISWETHQARNLQSELSCPDYKNLSHFKSVSNGLKAYDTRQCFVNELCRDSKKHLIFSSLLERSGLVG